MLRSSVGIAGRAISPRPPKQAPKLANGLSRAFVRKETSAAFLVAVLFKVPSLRRALPLLGPVDLATRPAPKAFSGMVLSSRRRSTGRFRTSLARTCLSWSWRTPSAICLPMIFKIPSGQHHDTFRNGQSSLAPRNRKNNALESFVHRRCFA